MKKTRRMTAAEMREIIDLSRGGRTRAEIADALALSATALFNAVQRMKSAGRWPKGLEIRRAKRGDRKPAPKPRRFFTPDDDRRLVEMILAGRRRVEIAEALGFTQAGVCNRIARLRAEGRGADDSDHDAERSVDRLSLAECCARHLHDLEAAGHRKGCGERVEKQGAPAVAVANARRLINAARALSSCYSSPAAICVEATL